MKYKITHTTSYSYSDAVAVCHNLVLLTPREGKNLICRSHRLSIRPTPRYSTRRTDYFGNLAHAFSIEESHRQMRVTASSRVDVTEQKRPAPGNTPVWEEIRDGAREATDANWLDMISFVYDSPLIVGSDEMAEYGRKSFAPNKPILAGLIDLTERVHAEFAYDKAATQVSTTAAEAFHLRRGVCQDLAHVQIGCLRSIGLPARYVSGYLRTLPPAGKPRLIGADESHAWLSVYCGELLGWVDVDPTNKTLCSTDHITVAWGREYGDVSPIKGVFSGGGGSHQLAVTVDVEPLN
jgi:transglutaminase-like putative cysteine protease